MIKIYTDGATSGNGKANAIGGWAYLILNDNNEIIKKNSGHIEKATNNICELTAILMGCEAVKDTADFVTVYSDSAYCINCYQEHWYLKWQMNGWFNSKKQPVANKELWKKLIPYFGKLKMCNIMRTITTVNIIAPADVFFSVKNSRFKPGIFRDNIFRQKSFEA